MRGPFPLGAQVVERFDKPLTEAEFPQAVDEGAGRERIVGLDDRRRQLAPATAMGKRPPLGSREHLQELARDQGMSMLMISSELEELVEGSDRVVVIKDGRTLGEFARAEASEDRVMKVISEG